LNELRQLVKRQLYHFDGVSRETCHFRVIPDISVELEKLALSILKLVLNHVNLIGKERQLFFINPSLLLKLYSYEVSLVYIHSDYDATSCNLRRSKVKETGFVYLEFTNLVAHVEHSFIEVVFKDSQETLHTLNRARKVIIEVHNCKNVSLQFDQAMLGYAHLLFIR
jgi:hypothetical protein